MKISVELTLMPLQHDFETPISRFIKRLRDSKFTVLENPMSTQILFCFEYQTDIKPKMTALISSSVSADE